MISSSQMGVLPEQKDQRELREGEGEGEGEDEAYQVTQTKFMAETVQKRYC